MYTTPMKLVRGPMFVAVLNQHQLFNTIIFSLNTFSRLVFPQPSLIPGATSTPTSPCSGPTSGLRSATRPSVSSTRPYRPSASSPRPRPRTHPSKIGWILTVAFVAQRLSTRLKSHDKRGCGFKSLRVLGFFLFFRLSIV